MRLEKAEEEARRRAIVAHIVTARTRHEFAQFNLDGHLASHFMARLAEKVKIKKTMIVGRVAYQLDMPLSDALEILKPTTYCAEVARRKAREATPEELRRPYTKRQPVTPEPAAEDYPWWGIIIRPQPLFCKEIGK